MADKTIWTIESLKEFEDEKVKQLEEKIDLQFSLNQTALDKAESRMNMRLESLNEWRGQLKDERNTFATKEEVRLLTRLVYIGTGILIALEFLLRYYK